MKIAGFLFFLLPLKIHCQDLSGTWVGSESGESYLKIVLIQTGDSCFGYTYDEGRGSCKTNFAGRFNRENQKLKGKGVSFIERSGDHVLAAYNLKYYKEGNEEYLQGAVGQVNTGGVMMALGMAAFAQLRKVSRSVDTTAFMLTSLAMQKKYADSTQAPIATLLADKEKAEPVINRQQNLSADTTVRAKEARKTGLVKTIYTNVDTVKMSLYDNGEVDDDTVTVFFDNRVIVDRYRISEKPKEMSIPLTKDGQPHIIELFANNLGKIPPNSALIILMAGSERYEIHASYDLSTNARIILQYKE